MPGTSIKKFSFAASTVLAATISATSLHAQAPAPASPEPPSFVFAPGKTSVEVPFELLANAVYVSATMNGKGPFLFALDTGSCCSAFSAELAGEMGLKPEGETMGMGAGSSTNKMGLVKGHIEFGFPQGVKLATDDANTLSFEGVWPLIGRRFYGNIGYDVLKDLIVRIDYEKKIITFTSPAAFKYTGSGQSFKTTMMMNYDPQFEGAFTVSGLAPIATKFTLDTGAGGTIVSTPLVKANHLLEAVHEKLPMPSHGVGEGVSQDLVGRIANLRLGRFEVEKPLVVISQDTAGSLTLPAIGVNLGGNILRHFTVIIDYPGKTLVLEPNSHFADAFHSDASGLILAASGDDFKTFTVQAIVPDSPAAKAGLKTGDVITMFDGAPASRYALWELQDELKNSGHRLKLEVKRGTQSIQCELTLKSLV
jgi:PDZ domain/Aspartyl protease